MFEHLPPVPGDPILGLIDQFTQDPNPSKVDLGVGVYRNDHGHTPILTSVKKAEALLLQKENSKAYIGSHGDLRFAKVMLPLVLGSDSRALLAKRASASQTPGGSGALKVAADFIHSHLPSAKVWLPLPTWSNHLGIFAGAGLELREYPYVGDDNQHDFESMLAALGRVPRGDVVLLHACCHNPTGFDLTSEQWQQVRDVLYERSLLPLVDFAYQGFGEGLEADAYGVRLLAESLDEIIITASCSKNFGLYRERTGCLVVTAKTRVQAENIRSQLAIHARHSYSSPPNHGGAIVCEILESHELSELWHEELLAMRSRIVQMRRAFTEAMGHYGLYEQFACITEQRGMFSYTGLTADQVKRLREEYSIYMVGSGRANISGMTRENIPYVAKAVANVVKA